MNKKIKLLLYGDYFRKPSGFGREFRDLIPHLKAKGYDIRQVALGFNGFPEDPEIKIYPGKFYNLKEHWAREMLEFAMEDFDPDIVLTLHDYYALPKIAFAMAYPKKAKWVHWGVLDGTPLGFGCKEPLKWVDYNLYHSNFAKQEIERVLSGIKGEVFYPATNPKVFYEMDKKQLKKDFGCENNFIVSTLARNQTRKNLPALIKSMKEVRKAIPNAILLLGLTQGVTITPEGDREGHEIQYLIDYFGTNEYIVMPQEKDSKGALSDKTIREIYNLGDIFCLPSMGEGFGMIFHESLACGVPVIGTDCSAVPETIGKYGWLMKPDAYFHSSDGVSQAIVNPKTISKEIITAGALDKKVLKEIAKKGKKYVNQFTPVNQANKLDIILKRVLNKDYKSLMRK